MWVLWVVAGLCAWVLLVAYGNLNAHRSLSNPHPAHESNDYGEKHRSS